MRVPLMRSSVLAGAAALGVMVPAACGQQPKPAKPGKIATQITPQSLPKPFATTSANNGQEVVRRPDGANLSVPPGFQITAWAQHVPTARVMAVAPNGDVFVSEHGPGRIEVLRQDPKTGLMARSVFADGLHQPFGLAFYPSAAKPKYLYVGNTDSVVRFPYRVGDLQASAPPETIVPDLPGGGYHQHWTRRVIFRPDAKKMYVSVGSQSNVGEEEPRRAAILEFNPDGSGYRIFASGIRNPVGLAFSPVTGKLWTAVNERDGLGDDLVPDYATSVKDGGFYGWPYYYIGANHDPRMPEKPALAQKTLVPDVLFESHSAALSILFPKAYQGSAFVAFHGSWNRAEPTGFKVVRIPFKPDGTAKNRYEDFVTGWRTVDGKVWGRPVDIAQWTDGSLLISDDGSETIWRVTKSR